MSVPADRRPPADREVARPPEPGALERVRSRHWLLEEVVPPEALGEATLVRLPGAEDDNAERSLAVLWEKELDAELSAAAGFDKLGERGFDPRPLFAGYVASLRRRTVTAADPRPLQVPFRAGIALAPYQLEPLAKALELPRVNLLLADDVGLGKTIETGLVIRELLLRGRIDFLLVAAPPAMSHEWQDELSTRFGPQLVPIDREGLRALSTAGRGFPHRRVEPIPIDGLPEDAPELVLGCLLARYRELVERRLEESRRPLRFAPDRLRRLVDTGLRLLYGSRGLLPAGCERATDGSPIPLFRLDPEDPALRAEPRLSRLLETLRPPLELRAELGEAIRPVTFVETDRLGDKVVQLHLEHPFLRRILARFGTQGVVEHLLSRVCLSSAAVGEPRVLLLGRLVLYGAGALRLHEEMLAVAAVWIPPERRRAPLRPLAERTSEALLDELDRLLDAEGEPGPPAALETELQAAIGCAVAELRPALEARTREAEARARRALEARGERESASLARLLAELEDRLGRKLARPPVRARLERARAPPAGRRAPRPGGTARSPRPRPRGRARAPARPLRGPGAKARTGRHRLSRAGGGAPPLKLADPLLERHREWLGFVQPVGLLLAPLVLVERQVALELHAAESEPWRERLEELLDDDGAAADPLAVLREVLEWPEEALPPAPAELDRHLPALDVHLRADRAIRASPDESEAFLGLVAVLQEDEPDRTRKDAEDGWQASAHARLERLLRETGLELGLLLTPKRLRLVFVPRGEDLGARRLSLRRHGLGGGTADPRRLPRPARPPLRPRRPARAPHARASAREPQPSGGGLGNPRPPGPRSASDPPRRLRGRPPGAPTRPRASRPSPPRPGSTRRSSRS